MPDPQREERQRRDNVEACPHCGANLQGQAIPEHQQADYGATHLTRKLGIYSAVRDRTVAWECPDCLRRWGRT